MILVTEKVTEMELLNIQEHPALQQAVSARELHEFLSGGERFSKWFERMVSYGFQINADYVGCTRWYAPANQELQDFFVSIDMAKEISMIQRSDKGKQARQYFIECERKLVNASQPVMALPDFTNPALAARAWADEVEAKLIAQEQLSIAQPKADALDYISTAVNSLNARDTAKTLGVQPKKFNDWCIAHQWMYRDSKTKLQMCSNRLQQGFMEQRNVTYHNSNGDLCATTQPMFTAKGLTHLAGIFSIVHEMS